MSMPAENASPLPASKIHLASSFSTISSIKSGIPNHTSKSNAFFLSGLLIQR